uniref:Secreted repeat protein with Y-X4-D motif n=1 Tax=Roseihalotalea indica TaxID=2867963 RepID=A0AA49GNZ5_9BACT|nr:hypothetical protein K4G66_31470 [Tunicatimonas sp. TK19036]
MKTFKHTFTVIAFLLLAIIFLSCSEDDTAPNDPAETSTQVQLSNDSELGSYLVNQEGRSLYFFSRDVNGSSICTDGCLDNWPVFFDENLEIDDELNASDFGSFTRADGQKQNTYKGWPLYYYSGDDTANQINGDGVGKVWFVAKPDYTVMLGNQLVEGNGDDPINYLVDAEGNSLYYFLNDQENISNCTDGCIQAWPAFQNTTVVLPSALEESRFGVIDRPDGGKQMVYDSQPVYLYTQDALRGQTKGASVPNWAITRVVW